MADKQFVILVIEDEQPVRALLTEILTDKPHRTVTAVSNGAEALAFLDGVRPHLITLDLTMPGLDGIAVYKLIREREALNDVPVLFISALNRQRTHALCGRFEWLSKPFDINKLDAVIDALLAESER